jgi:histidinol phosphatase-like enzyme
MKHYKILFADLDGTLIKTKSGKTFPEGIWDMEFKFEVLDAIKALNPIYVCIVSNQGNIEKGLVNEIFFYSKIDYVSSVIYDFKL